MRRLFQLALCLVLVLPAFAQVCTPTYATGAAGAPLFGGLRNDSCPVVIGNIPDLWANFAGDSGYTGAGKCATNSLGQVICRLTDANTASTVGISQLNNYSGGDSDEHWGYGDNLIYWGGASQSHTYVAAFNPANFVPGTGTSPFIQFSNSGSLYSIPSKSVAASQTTANWAWVFDTTSNCASTGPCAIKKYDFTPCVSAPTSCSPTVTTLWDFAAGGTTLNSCLNNTWNGVFRVSSDDTLFSIGISNNQGTHGQGSGTLLLTYKVGSGESIWNTGNATVCGILAGHVAGNYGSTGAMTMTGCAGTSAACTGGADQFLIHDAQTFNANNLVVVSSDSCLAGTCTGTTPPTGNYDQPYLWIPGTLTSFSEGGGQVGGESGHAAYGYKSIVHGGTPKPQDKFVPVISSGVVFANGMQGCAGVECTILSSSFLSGFVPGAVTLDVHMSWNPDTANDTWPLLQSTTDYQASLSTANNMANNGCVIPATGFSGTPNCGVTNPFSGPGVNELLVYQTSNTPNGSTPCASWSGASYTGTAPCTTTALGRPGLNGISALNPSFNAQNASIAWSQTGKYYSVTTDWFCTFGNAAGTGATICGGLAWKASNSYNSGDVITPSSNNGPNCTFTSSGGTSGSTQPTTWASGSTCATTVTESGGTGIVWTSVGKQNARYDVVVGALGNYAAVPAPPVNLLGVVH